MNREARASELKLRRVAELSCMARLLSLRIDFIDVQSPHAEG
jgi:hypothetical protein